MKRRLIVYGYHVYAIVHININNCLFTIVFAIDNVDYMIRYI